MLITGRLEPTTGLAGRQAKARIVIRAVILLVVGTAPAMTNFDGGVIINFYAVYFLLALPCCGPGPSRPSRSRSRSWRRRWRTACGRCSANRS
ncbi:hypothetical protein [Streptomyces sp. NPDC014995]|uniref:hypothetical protein n=1 Tax=Streptomyces sp. NPDC014995 TaxID=3364936 RepID=UPI0036F50699